MDNLSVFFLAEREQSADDVMARLAAFILGAKQTLDFAVYDMRFSDPLRTQLVAALRERAQAGVEIRFCYDADKPLQPNVAAGQDPAPSGTGAFVQSLGYPWRRIAGMKLMHSKFVVRDGRAAWAGSANMTDDAFTLMENNIVEMDSPLLAGYYAQDFEELWEKQNFENTGEIRTEPVSLTFSNQSAAARVMFSPGCGLEIDTEIARRVRLAQRRVRICSLLINSGTLIGELGNLLHHGRVTVDGIYDRTLVSRVANDVIPICIDVHLVADENAMWRDHSRRSLQPIDIRRRIIVLFQWPGSARVPQGRRPLGESGRKHWQREQQQVVER